MKSTGVPNDIFVLIVAVTVLPMILCADAPNTSTTNQPVPNTSGTALLDQLAGMEFDKAKEILDTL